MFDPLPEKMLSDLFFSLSATASSGLPVSFYIPNPSVAVVDNNIVTLINGGNTSVVASQAGNENYLPAENIEQPLIVKIITELESSSNLRKIFILTLHLLS